MEMESIVFLLPEFLSYLDPYGLSQASVVSKHWSILCNESIAEWLSRPLIRYNTYKPRHDITIVSQCALAWSDFKPPSTHTRGIFMHGGAFRSQSDEFILLDQPGDQIRLRTLNIRLPDKIGAMATCIDGEGRALMLGGWSEDFEQVLSSTWTFDMSAKLVETALELPTPICYGASTATLEGHVVHAGGGLSPYRGAEVLDEVIVKRWGDDTTDMWIPLPPLSVRRCGHSVVTTFDNAIIAAGGYEGGLSYLSSVERLDTGSERWTPLPAMCNARSGFGMVLGPHGLIYVAGGSLDGTRGSKTSEMLDVREGRWHRLPDMSLPRGYTDACMDLQGRVWVTGGQHRQSFQKEIEIFDCRMGVWSLFRTDQMVWETESVPLVDRSSAVDPTVQTTLINMTLSRGCHHTVLLL